LKFRGEKADGDVRISKILKILTPLWRHWSPIVANMAQNSPKTQ
jgi:hypothetical protein